MLYKDLHLEYVHKRTLGHLGFWGTPIAVLGGISRNWPIAAIYGGIMGAATFRFVEKRAAVSVMSKG
jgi:hypothetical protein